MMPASSEQRIGIEENRPPRRALAAAALLLLLLGIIAFAPAVKNGFVNYDDDLYVLKNGSVRAGLTAESVKWAFTSVAAGNWHPLTWISHMLDVEIYGVDPAGHHRTSVILHLVNALLLLWALHWMTGAVWRSFLVAALFAVHPLHVESVAWVAERKDVLSGFFWLLTILFYIPFARRPSPARFLPVCLALAAGLLAKPMVVTLPFILLLLDSWPLQRMHPGKDSLRRTLGLFLEKAPLFILVLISAVVTFHAQSRGGAISAAEGIPLLERMANASVAYVGYLWKMIWPRGLAVFYPFREAGIPWPVSVGSAGLLALVTWLAWRDRRRWLLTGWLWYVGSLVPVIGLVRVGSQAMADRYMYLPLIGIFWILAWQAEELVRDRRAIRGILSTALAAALILLTVTTRAQVRVWQSSLTLFRHALSVTADNTLARLNLGEALASAGQIEEAMENFRRAVQLHPENYMARHNLGLALADLGRFDEAIPHYREAVRAKPDFQEALYNLGEALIRVGDLDEAAAALAQTVRLEPNHFRAHCSLGNIAARRGQKEEALASYREALRIQPDYPEVLNNMGAVLASQGKREDAAVLFRRALELQPTYEDARRNLDRLLRQGTP